MLLDSLEVGGKYLHEVVYEPRPVLVLVPRSFGLNRLRKGIYQRGIAREDIDRVSYDADDFVCCELPH